MFSVLLYNIYIISQILPLGLQSQQYLLPAHYRILPIPTLKCLLSLNRFFNKYFHMTSLFIFYKKIKIKGKRKLIVFKAWNIYTDTDYLKPNKTNSSLIHREKHQFTLFSCHVMQKKKKKMLSSTQKNKNTFFETEFMSLLYFIRSIV